MIPINKVKSIIKNYEQLEKELASETSDKKLFVKKSKEYAHLSEVINDAKFFINLEKEIKSLEKNQKIRTRSELFKSNNYQKKMKLVFSMAVVIMTNIPGQLIKVKI